MSDGHCEGSAKALPTQKKAVHATRCKGSAIARAQSKLCQHEKRNVLVTRVELGSSRRFSQGLANTKEKDVRNEAQRDCHREDSARALPARQGDVHITGVRGRSSRRFSQSFANTEEKMYATKRKESATAKTQPKLCQHGRRRCKQRGPKGVTPRRFSQGFAIPERCVRRTRRVVVKAQLIFVPFLSFSTRSHHVIQRADGPIKDACAGSSTAAGGVPTFMTCIATADPVIW